MRTRTRKILIHSCVLAVPLLVTLNTPGRAAELAGATLPDTLSAGDKSLKLNGLGLLRPGFTAIGGVTDADISIIAATGVCVVACVQSDLRLGGRVVPLSLLDEQNLKISPLDRVQVLSHPDQAALAV